ncbi:PD40 domain-containing protein [Lutibacter sp. B2]|nr:PD40 domain-containing protein [Lutibacter sp. B2]
MEKLSNHLIKKIGINPCLKEKSKYFSLKSFEEVITLPEDMPDMKEIVSVMIEPEIISQKTIDSIKGLSSEGQYLSGKKIVLHVKLKQKILYAADIAKKTIHTIQNENFQSIYISIPLLMEGTDPKELLKFEYLKTEIYTQDIIMKKINNRSIFKNVILLIDTFLIPTYQLTYTIHEDNRSNIFIAHKDGAHKKQITFSHKHYNIKPVWSPTGWEIAFLSDRENKNGKHMLYVYCLKDGKIKKLTDSHRFHMVSSFCWSHEGQTIIFSASFKNQKQLFSIDINTLECTQLTFGNSEIKNYKPKYSPTDKKVAFFQSISGVSNLFVMDMERLNITKLTSCGFIKDFDWSNNGQYISYISGKSGECDQVCLMDLNKMEKVFLKIPGRILTTRNINFSPDNHHIAFIGSDFVTENIFDYDLRKNRMINVTKNLSDIKISSFVWKIDSSQIYYAANDLSYYNIYTIYLKDFSRYSLTSTIASDIRLSYRTKII